MISEDTVELERVLRILSPSPVLIIVAGQCKVARRSCVPDLSLGHLVDLDNVSINSAYCIHYK